MNIHIIF